MINFDLELEEPELPLEEGLQKRPEENSKNRLCLIKESISEVVKTSNTNKFFNPSPYKIEKAH